jgi:hypothetical protein
MKPKSPTTLSIAGVFLALLFPVFALAGNMQSSQASSSTKARVPGQREAMRMVPARVALPETLDAKKTQPGHEFRATLANTVHLDNGPELPVGTALVGTVVTDDMQLKGMSKLALRFTKAELKDGRVVPIKATIVGVFAPEWMSPGGYPINPGDQAPNSWNDGTLQVEQIGATPGVDLHSKIASRNSGVFVSTTKDDVKLDKGSEIALAIAAQGHPGQTK